MKIFDGISFIGGIHGVGKSTICQHICRELNMEYLSASELLKWQEISKDVKNKKVENISDTQNRLILGLERTIQNGKHYLLDGHFCLLNNHNEVICVPLEIFKQINPISLNLILGDISEVKERLEKRDNKLYEYDLLEHLQNKELSYARHLSKTLGITLHIGTYNHYSEMLILLGKALALK